MQKIITTLLLCFMLTQAFAQPKKIVSGYFSAQLSFPVYDQTVQRNKYGGGPGLQLFFNTPGKIKPVIELLAETYPSPNKLLTVDADGDAVDDIGLLADVFGGFSYHPAKQVYLSFSAGPVFINEGVRMGIKPALGFYFPSSKRWMGRIAFTNIYDRNKKTKEDFGALSFSIGTRIF